MKQPPKSFKASRSEAKTNAQRNPAKATQPATPSLKDVTPAADTTTAFLREVDEAMQQERLLAVWHNSKYFILAAIIMLILAVAGQQGWHAWQKHNARTVAAQWYAYSISKDDAARKTELTKLLQSTDGGTHALAVYQLAAMQHTPEEKAKAYQQLVKDDNVPSWLRDIARLNAAIALIGSNPAAAKAELEVLAQTNAEQIASPAYAPALELLALLAQQANDAASAKGYTIKLLQQPGLPSDMRQRALQRIGALGGLPTSL